MQEGARLRIGGNKRRDGEARLMVYASKKKYENGDKKVVNYVLFILTSRHLDSIIESNSDSCPTLKRHSHLTQQNQCFRRYCASNKSMRGAMRKVQLRR